MAINVILTLTKNAIGTKLVGDEFEFTLYDEFGVKVGDATNDAAGIATFDLQFNTTGNYSFTLEETDTPVGWTRDETVYPVEIEVVDTPVGLSASVSYPQGHPGFVNRLEADPCSSIEFPELSFDHPGTYEYTLKEITASGGGWVVDDTVYRVIITVVDDGYGNLIATIDYPDGYPQFTNTYVLQPVKVIISATKTAVGKELSCGMFQFGLFDGEVLVATAFNGPTPEPEPEPDPS